jgi:hypothetical protein
MGRRSGFVQSALGTDAGTGERTVGKDSNGHKRTLCLAADLVTLQGKLAISCATRRSVPGMCRAQIGCAMNVPWCGWGEGWQALQVIDY